MDKGSLMLIRAIILLLFFTLTAVNAAPLSNLTYESSEHIFMGDQVVLHGGLLSPHLFTLPNGLTLTYGELISMPDFYGDPDHQISSESTLFAQKNRFSEAYDNFAHSDIAYFNAFWPVIQDERKQITEAIKNNEEVSAVYKRIIGPELLKLEWVTNFKYFALAEKSFDHFGDDAWAAYVAGHSVAIDTAIAGYRMVNGFDNTTNQQCESAKNKSTCLAAAAKTALETAYAENAFANHFLTDRLAASHMRTPFRALVTTASFPDFGAIAGNYMHNEDGKYGVIVTNQKGNVWMAYGDDFYIDPKNATHRSVIQALLQQSADEIFTAFEKGYDIDPDSAILKTFLPFPIPPGNTVVIPNRGSITQSAPLFVNNQGVVWERQALNNRFDNTWTKDWSTVQLILTYHVVDLSSPLQYFMDEKNAKKSTTISTRATSH